MYCDRILLVGVGILVAGPLIAAVVYLCRFLREHFIQRGSGDYCSDRETKLL